MCSLCRFIAQVLDKTILDTKLCDSWENWGGNTFVKQGNEGIRDEAYQLSFADLDNKELKFPSDCEMRPYKRVLCFHAHVVNGKAARNGWGQVPFEDFWSEADEFGNNLTYIEPVRAKIQAWLERPFQQTP
jgi:hypothetical protein